MPAGSGEDAQRFAAAVERGESARSTGDGELARELRIVAMLRTCGQALDPEPADRDRAKLRLLAALAGTPGGRAGGSRYATPDELVETGADPAAAELLRQVDQLRSAPLDRTAKPMAAPAGAAADVEPLSYRPLTPVFPFGRATARTRPGSAANVSPVAAAATGPVRADVAAEQLLRQVSRGHAAEADPLPSPIADAVAAEQPSSPIPPRPASTARPPRPSGRHSMPLRPDGRSDTVRPGRPRRRMSLVGSAALVLAIALAGMSVLGSRDALPGQTLYGVKRVAESTGLALTFDDVTKARRHLQLASTRLDEVEQLVAADPGTHTEHPELLDSAITEFDDSTGEAARILFGADAASGGVDGRADLRTWAAQQQARLSQLKPALPDSTGAADAMHLLDRVVVRTDALQVPSCAEQPTGATDDLGPVPGCTAPGPGSDPAADATPDGVGDPRPSTSPGAVDDPTSDSASTSAATPGGPGTSRPSGPDATARPDSSRETPTESKAPSAEPDPSPEDDGASADGTPRDAEPSSSPAADSDADDDGLLDGEPPAGSLLPGLGL